MGFRGTNALVEARIQEARANGVFEDLPGAGKPLHLEDLDGLSPDQRIEALVLRNSGEVSAETALLREIHGLRAKLSECRDVDACERVREEIRKKAHEVHELLEQRRIAAIAERKAARKP